jgi:RNA polymerase sigma factor (sigma-70 family)
MNYKEILELISQKEKKGLEALYASYGQKFYTYAINKWLLNEDEAWEVVYQTLDTLVLKLSKYEFESKTHFDNFIFKVFTNFLRQYFRSHRKHQHDIVYVDFNLDNSHDGDANSIETNNIEKDESILEIDDQSFNNYYSSEIIENPKLLALRDALGQMDKTEKEILLLRAQNYSYDEIALMLKIENNQLKVKHHRAKIKLMQLLNHS